MIAEKEKAVLNELNPPAASKCFNPNRNSSSIDFKNYGQELRQGEVSPLQRPLRR